MGRWVAAIVRDGAETALAAELPSAIRAETYCPLHKRWRCLPKHIVRKTGRNRELIVGSLIEGYLFVRIEDDAQLAAMLAFKGVYGVVRTMNGPCFAREEDIEALKAAEASGFHDAKVRAKHIKPASDKQVAESMRVALRGLTLSDIKGRKVMLTSGPFSGMSGEVTEVNGDCVKVQTGALPITVSAGSFELA